MLFYRRQLLLKAFKLLDLAVMGLAFLFTTIAAHFQRHNIPFDDFLNMRIKIGNFLLFSGFTWIWYLLFVAFKLYHSRRLASRISEVIDIIKATFTGTLVLVVMAIVFSMEMITPIFVLVFLCSVSFLTIVARLAVRIFLGQLRLRGRNMRNMLIAGTNVRAINFARSLEAKPELGYHIIGFVDEEWPGLQEFQKSGYPLVTDLNSFSPYIRQHVVDEVAINLPMRSYYQHAAQIADLCAEQGITVRHQSDLFDLKNGRFREESVEEEDVITVVHDRMAGWQLAVKRIFDFTLSAILLIISAPIFLVSALLIKLNSPGPVFFSQERVGFSKRTFKMYKFRTMVADAEQKQAELEHLNEASGPVFKIKNDPRITGIGKFLRKTSIDELPQLINILRGEMSLVGPRPLPVRDFNGFDQDWHRRRFSVRPGITCLWQIRGRNEISFDKWMELDMKYIDHWSLSLDFKILIMTIKAVLEGYGAA
jgi:exopolysaccharide biosynthesis polyprenyl glycosylphosphotransferase